MKIEITKGSSPLAKKFSAPLSPEGEAEYLKLMFVEELLSAMKEQSVSRTELARRMGVQPSRITSMLTGSNNFTIETMVRACRAIGIRLHQKLAPEKAKVRWDVWGEEEVHPIFRAYLKPVVKNDVTFILGGQCKEDADAAA